MNKVIPVITGLFSFIGIIDSGYLSYTRFTGTEIVCDAFGALSGCNEVAASPFSEFLGIPLAYLGLAFYLAIFVLSIVLFFKRNEDLKQLLLAFTAVGFLSSMYFMYLQAYVIFAFCIYCVISAITSTLLLGIAAYWLWFLKEDNQQE